MAQDPAGRAILAGGLTLLALWLAVAGGTVWLFLRRADPPVSLAWLWVGGAVTLLGVVAIAALAYASLPSRDGRGEREWQDHLDGLRTDERRRGAERADVP